MRECTLGLGAAMLVAGDAAADESEARARRTRALADGTGAGLPTLAVLRSPEQAAARWQVPLWQHADLRLALGDSTADSLPPSVRDAIRLR